jgi:hypothetical protein
MAADSESKTLQEAKGAKKRHLCRYEDTVVWFICGGSVYTSISIINLMYITLILLTIYRCPMSTYSTHSYLALPP